jgi:poly-beta-1,6-N-acetyl-D-glucosamine synthase
LRIVIITPTRNEERTIRTTIECMIQQTVLPEKWVIVNDGSTDETENIILQYYNKKYPFIDYVPLADRGYRKPGKGVVEVFYEGLKKIGSLDYDIIAKFDADLNFPPDAIETICQAFKDDPYLGITGGTLYERKNNQGAFKKLYASDGYVCGPNKFYRKKCFEDIDGLILRAGWDGVDIIRANMKGWKTSAIEPLIMMHLKTTGTAKGEGLRKACEKYGDISYYMGGYIWYFVLRIIGRSWESKNLQVGYYMLKGYLISKIQKKERESIEFRSFLKTKQLQHIAFMINNAIDYLRLRKVSMRNMK